jgi:hypothetical protein
MFKPRAFVDNKIAITFWLELVSDVDIRLPGHSCWRSLVPVTGLRQEHGERRNTTDRRVHVKDGIDERGFTRAYL